MLNDGRERLQFGVAKTQFGIQNYKLSMSKWIKWVKSGQQDKMLSGSAGILYSTLLEAHTSTEIIHFKILIKYCLQLE